MSWRIRLAALTLCLCTAHVGAAPLSLNGRALGERLDDVLNDPRYECGCASACLLYTVCTLKLPGSETLAGAPLEALTLHFGGERLTAIEAQFPPEQFDLLLTDLTREHGPGATQASEMHRYSSGSADDTVRVWRQGRRLLRVERFWRNSTRSSLIISEQSFLSEVLGQ
jgi:hypothetical protein